MQSLPRPAIPLDVQIKAVQRELALRQAVFPAQVAKGRLTQARADEHIAQMQAVLHTLEQLQEAQAFVQAVYP